MIKSVGKTSPLDPRKPGRGNCVLSKYLALLIYLVCSRRALTADF